MAPQQAAPQTAGRRRSRAGKKKASGNDTALLLFGDAFVTALWVMISSLFAEVSTSSFHDTLHTCLVVDGPCMPPSVLLFALLFPLRACPFHGSCTTWQGPPNPHPCFSLCVCLSNMSGLDSRTLHRPYRDPAVFYHLHPQHTTPLCPPLTVASALQTLQGSRDPPRDQRPWCVVALDCFLPCSFQSQSMCTPIMSLIHANLQAAETLHEISDLAESALAVLIAMLVGLSWSTFLP